MCAANMVSHLPGCELDSEANEMCRMTIPESMRVHGISFCAESLADVLQIGGHYAGYRRSSENERLVVL